MVLNTPVPSNSIRDCLLQNLRGKVRILDAPLADADDALQEACVRFMEQAEIHAWEENRILAWLLATAWNYLLDLYKKQNRCIPLYEDDAANAANAANAETSMEELIVWHIAWERAFDRLSSEDRRLLQKKEAGLTNPEIAAERDLPVETIKKRDQRATERFRRQLAVQGIEIPTRKVH